jgi:putative membrane protein
MLLGPAVDPSHTGPRLVNASDDPRVFLAAERSLLAWNRTCLAMMGLGFVIERFGLFLRVLDPTHAPPGHRGASYAVGLALLLFASVLAVYSTFAFRDEIAGLAEPERRPTHYASLAVIANLGVAAAGIALVIYLAFAAR